MDPQQQHDQRHQVRSAMPGSHQQQQLPAWLRAVREAGPSPWGQCTEVTRKERSCTIEDTSDGRRYRQCTEVLRRFRVCAGREPEEVATSVIETHEPLVDLDVASAEHSQRGASVVPSDAGQLLEEFFAFAGELKQELLRSGALPAPSSSHSSSGPSSSGQQTAAPASSGGGGGGAGGLLGRLFGWRSAASRARGEQDQAHGQARPTVAGSTVSGRILCSYALPQQDV